MLSPIHSHIHITLLYSAYEAMVKSIPRKTLVMENMNKKPMQLNIMLSPFCVESHFGEKSILGWVIRFGVESILGWVPFGIESIQGWVPFDVKSIQGWVHSRLSPFEVESIWGWVHLRLSPFEVQSDSGLSPIRGWVHSGLRPFGVQSHSGFSPIRGSVYSDKSPILGSVGESLVIVVLWS